MDCREPSRLNRTLHRHKLIASFLFSIIYATLPGRFYTVSAQESIKPDFKSVDLVKEDHNPLKSKYVTVRYRAVDLEHGLRNWPRQSPSLENLVEQLTSVGVGRVILPDPLAGNHKNIPIREFAELLAEQQIEIWFELSPSEIKSQDEALHKALDERSGPLDTSHADMLNRAYLTRCKELSELTSEDGISLTSGFFFPLRAGESLPAGLEAEATESNFRAFLDSMELARDWAKTLDSPEKRTQFLKTTGLMPWITWRNREVARFYTELGAQVHKTTRLRITFAAPSTADPTSAALFAEAHAAGMSPAKAWQWMAFDPLIWPHHESFSLMSSESLQNQADAREIVNHPDLVEPMKSRIPGGHWFVTESPVHKSVFRFAGFSQNQLVDLQTAFSTLLVRQDSPLLVVDYPAIARSDKFLRETIRKKSRLTGQSFQIRQSPVSAQGVTARYYPESDPGSFVIINALPCRMVVKFMAVVPHPEFYMDSPDLLLNESDAHGSKPRSEHLWSIPPHTLARINVRGLDLQNLLFEATVPDDARDIVQTRYEALLDQHSEPAEIQASSKPDQPAQAEKSKGRRTMAAFQAYRESRLADFFRISDGILKERRTQRSINRSARLTDEDSQTDRIIR